MKLHNASVGILRYQGNLMRPTFARLSQFGGNVVGFCDQGGASDRDIRIDVMSNGRTFHHIGMDRDFKEQWPPINGDEFGLLVNAVETGKETSDEQEIITSSKRLAGLRCAKLMVVSRSALVLEQIAKFANGDFLGVKVSTSTPPATSSAPETIAKAATFFFDTPGGIVEPSLLDISSI